jgi:glycosyltransferase involved in cell wall biosynthesis
MFKMIKGMVSIVVPTHGNRDLSKLKNSIVNSFYQNIELIIVNRNEERSVQRNYGIDQAKGEFLLWLDSDQSISPLLLNECVAMMRKGYDALYIPEIIVANSFFGRVRAFERTFYTGTSIDCVRFIRLDECPRFDTSLHGPEDSDFDRRVKGKRGVTRGVLYHHDDIKILEYFRKKGYYARSLQKYSEKNPSDRCLNFYYRCFGVFYENGKWWRIINHPFLYLCVGLIIFVRGLIYVSVSMCSKLQAR